MRKRFQRGDLGQRIDDGLDAPRSDEARRWRHEARRRFDEARRRVNEGPRQSDAARRLFERSDGRLSRGRLLSVVLGAKGLRDGTADHLRIYRRRGHGTVALRAAGVADRALGGGYRRSATAARDRRGPSGLLHLRHRGAGLRHLRSRAAQRLPAQAGDRRPARLRDRADGPAAGRPAGGLDESVREQGRRRQRQGRWLLVRGRRRPQPGRWHGLRRSSAAGDRASASVRHWRAR